MYNTGEIAMRKKPSDYPRLNLRISEEMHNWLRDYAQRQGKSMSAILKEHLTELRRKDEHLQTPTHG
jgi:predicted HicB family RNase H-like nuclease